MSTQKIIEYLSRILIILLVLPLHELAHGFVAKKLGDDTAERQGRLTLNPLAHIDPFGAILLIFTGFGWAKPVPINPMRMKKYRAGISLTALAGPVSNILAAFVCGIIYNVAICFETVQTAIYNGYFGEISVIYCFMLLLQFVFIININLAVFNLLPIPPLDGFNIIRYFTSAKFDMWVSRNMYYINIAFIAFILILNQIPIQYNILYILSNGLQQIISFCIDWIPDVIGTI